MFVKVLGARGISSPNLHTMERSSCTFIGIVYTFITFPRNWLCIIGCLPHSQHASQNMARISGPIQWSLDEGYCETFRGVALRRNSNSASLSSQDPPFSCRQQFHLSCWTSHCVVSSNSAFHCVVNSAFLSSWVSLPTPNSKQQLYLFSLVFKDVAFLWFLCSSLQFANKVIVSLIQRRYDYILSPICEYHI